MPGDTRLRVEHHYGVNELLNSSLDALGATGKDVDQLVPADLRTETTRSAPVDGRQHPAEVREPDSQPAGVSHHSYPVSSCNNLNPTILAAARVPRKC